MLFKPTSTDLKVIAFYTGKVLAGFGLTVLIPFITAMLFHEWNMAAAFLISFSLCEIFWLATDKYLFTERDLNWLQGMMVVSFSWLFAVLIGSIPLMISGFFGSYLDACFDVMSGLTTTGLTLIQDLDHAPYSINMWRHLLQFIGAQGIIVLALTFFVRAMKGAIKIYAGEAREGRLLPNIINTARAIWFITLTYFAIGTTALFIVSLTIGIGPARAFTQSMWVYMTAWGTGGFSPMSLSIGYYHSPLFEFFTIIFMVVGSFNFALHWAVWTGNRRELFKNIEILSFTTTVLITFFITANALLQKGYYSSIFSGARKIFFQVISAHSGTGFMTITAGQFANQWREFAMLGIIIAMALGAGASSTAGGFKALRIGLVIKGLISEVKKFISPESSVVVTYYHHIRDEILTDNQVKMAAIIILAYTSTYLLGGIIGQFYGYPFVNSLFDSVSAGANVGLSCGVTSPSMPAVMKIYYIFSMWMGRLEFASIFALAGFIVAAIKGKG